MKRAAVYYRMSKDDQADSPERQRMAVEQYCKQKGYRIVEVYEDEGMRGWDDSRPNFNRLLEDAKARKFDVVVADEASRLSRQNPLRFFMKVAGPLDDAGVAIETVAGGPLGGRELVPMLMTLLQQDKAAQESVTLGRRSATGLFRLASQEGAFVGKAPFGYREVRDADGRRRFEHGDAPQLAIVRRIFDEYVKRDASIGAIVKRLNAEQICPPHRSEKWSVSTVHAMLRNPIYAGDLVFGRHGRGKFARVTKDGTTAVTGPGKTERRDPSEWMVRKDAVPPIVERAVFEQAQRLLVENRKRSSPSRKNQEYPFSQLLRCGCCGRGMWGVECKGGKKAYRCGSAISNQDCGNRTVYESVVTDHVMRALRDQFLQPANLERLRAEVGEQFRSGQGDAEEKARSLRKALQQLDSNIKKGERNLAMMDTEFIAGAQRQIREWKTEREEVVRQLELAERTDVSEQFEHVISRIEEFVAAAGEANPDELRALVRSVIDHVNIHTDTVQRAKYRKYPLRGGEIVLNVAGDNSKGSSETPTAIELRSSSG